MKKPKKQGAGRPRLPDDERRENVLRIRLTDDERERLDAMAKTQSLDTSTWARLALLRRS